MIQKENKKVKQVDFTANSVEKNALLPKNAFLKKHKISSANFELTKLKWNVLQKIHAHYIQNQGLYQGVATEVSNKFLTTEAKDVGVHSVRSRLKSPEGLIEKIIRKTIDSKKKKEKHTKSFTVKNYNKQITDLIGIRVLHVFKNDWLGIHNFILSVCSYKTIEKPTAYFRKGDAKSFVDHCKKNGCDPKVHPKAYRSIHYIIEPYPDKKIYIEIQVRTVFEDGWSEIDHKLRYNTKTNKKHLLDPYLLALNRIAGSADEIGTIIRNRQSELQQADYEKKSNVKKGR